MSDRVARPRGCLCQWEFGDSECPVHPTCPECGLPTAPDNQCECPKPARLTIAEYVERCKALLDDPEQCKCPKCGGQILAMHGLAGGGMGPYIVCMACAEIVLKGFEDDGEGGCFHA